MSVRRRTWTNRQTGAQEEKWMVDVKFEHPDGSVERVRKVSPVQTRRGAEQYERDVRQSLLDGSYGKEDERPVPMLAAFVEEFMASYVANNNKPSEESAKKGHFKWHIVPLLGRMRLDVIGPRDIETYKAKKLAEELNKKSINNQLSSLRKLLNVAVEWGVIERAPRVKPFKLAPTDFDFLSFEEAQRLIDAADEGTWRTMVVTALNTGLRLGGRCPSDC